MRNFTINSSKQILDLYGNPFIIRGVTFLDYLFCSFETNRTAVTQRKIPGKTAPTPPASEPTYFASEMWRNKTHIAAIIDRMASEGINCIRVGYEPATQFTAAWTDTDGTVYPSDYEMLDTVVELAGQKEMLVIFTSGFPYISNSANIAYVTNIATRYGAGGSHESPYVAINPKNEINCEAGNSGCTTSATWVTDQAAYVSAIRTAGFAGLIFLNPNNAGHDLNICQAGFIANSVLNNDGGIVIGVHSYQRQGTDVDFNATRIAYETSSWYQYRGNFCIVNEESGIYNFTGRFDPNLDSTVAATNPTFWAQMQAYKTSEMAWYVDACQNQGVNGLIACRWNAYFAQIATPQHDDNSLVRRDGSWTTWGLIFRDGFLKPMLGVTPPPPPAYTTIFTQSFASQSGAAAGYLFANTYNAGAFSGDASVIRVTVNAPSSSSMVIAEMFIGEKATGGDEWDFVSTPTRITFGGSNGISLTAGNHTVSDDITFVLDNTKNYVIRASLTSGAVAYGSASSSYYYEAAAASSIATPNISGMSPIGSSHSIVSKVESKP